ncbi:MAG: hypothetical protein CK425_11250 [Parachlamydia sp.]|nr:MAG: hypothetical protein CK425_11250 [Parachlamydia sp.]
MSGIDAIKKKAKLSMDEMYEDKPVGKMGNQNNGQQDIQQNNQTVSHKNIKQPNNPLGNQIENPRIQQPSHPENHLGQSNLIHEANNPNFGDLRMQQSNPEIHASREINSLTRPALNFSSSQTQSQKMQTYKMTFNLPENVYKAFNDLYAQRMLQGRKTEKANLICEAIDWLIKMEQQH